MADERAEALFARIRALEPTRAELVRVLDGVEERRRRPERRFDPRILMAASGAALAAGLLLVLWPGGVPSVPPVRGPRLLSAHGVTVEHEDTAVGDRVAWGAQVEVAAEGRARLATDDATVELGGGALATWREDRGLVLESGRVEITGELDVSAPGCEVCVHGRALAQRDADGTVHIEVFAGSVERVGLTAACRFEDLPAPTEPEAAEPDATPEPDREAEVEASRASTGVARSTSRDASLVAQTRAYDEARARMEADPAESLRAFRAHRRRWPRSLLRPEVDLNVIELLARLGRDRQARAEAERYLRQHPDSPRSAELRRFVDGGEP